MNANRNSIIAIVVAFLALGAAAAALGVFGGGELGTTNFDDLTLSGDLSVGDDLAVTGDTTFTGNVTGVISNDLNGAAIVLDPGGTSKLQATANFKPILTLGGTPTAASLTVNDSAGTPVAVFRGGAGGTILNASGGFAFNGPIAVATSAPLAGVASTAVAPVGVLQPVSMATAGTVPVTIPPAGQIVCVWNTGSETVTIADTGNQMLSASGALGQYDTLCFISDGTRVLEFARSNN